MLDSVLQFVPHDGWKSWIIDFRDPHWGQSKGGAVSLNAWHARMRHDPARYYAVQSKRFRKSGEYRYRTSAGYEVRSLYELVVAENLIMNLVPHQYERMLRCGQRLLFPDFFVHGNRRSVLIEVYGFHSEKNWKRLLEKLGTYRTHEAANILVVVCVRQDENFVTRMIQRFGHNVHLISIDELGGMGAILRQAHDSLTNFRTVTESDALRRSSRIEGKQVHWQRLLSTVPKEAWIETLASCGIPESDLRRIRKIIGLKLRLLEATRLATKLGLVPREALVEMIAGTYNGAAGDRFGSMGTLALLAETPNLEKFT